MSWVADVVVHFFSNFLRFSLYGFVGFHLIGVCLLGFLLPSDYHFLGIFMRVQRLGADGSGHGLGAVRGSRVLLLSYFVRQLT
jgi:hypothetical protein